MSDKGPSRLEAVFLDLDGSLLNSQRQIGEEDRRTVARLVEAGVRVYISTGRHYELSARYHRELGLTGTGAPGDLRLNASETYARTLVVIDKVLDLIAPAAQPKASGPEKSQ